MKFLLGMTFGVLCAVGVMMFPEAREAVLVELDLQTQALSEIARRKSLQSIKSTFLDESVYSDIVKATAQSRLKTETEYEPDSGSKQVLWADQIAFAESLPLLEPAGMPPTFVSVDEPVASVTNQAEVVVIQTPVQMIAPVFHAVWSPFRSERSAAGFATTLSMRMNREFRVVRLSAGRYEVGFDYSSEQELINVLDSVLEFTSSGVVNQQVSL